MTKVELFNQFALFRQCGRKLVEWRGLVNDKRLYLARQKRKMEAENNRFHSHRIEECKKGIQALHEELDKVDAKIAELGPALKELCRQADSMFSFTDKAHALGVNERHLFRTMDGKDQDAELFTMIFAHHAECRDKEDFIGPYRHDMPLWTIASAYFHHLLATNEEFAAKIREGFDEFFPGLTKYKQVIAPDGTVTMQRLPPNLKIVARNA